MCTYIAVASKFECGALEYARYIAADVIRAIINTLWGLLLQLFVSTKWGFTKWERVDYERMRSEGTLVPDGVSVQYRPDHGPLQRWMEAQV